MRAANPGRMSTNPQPSQPPPPPGYGPGQYGPGGTGMPQLPVINGEFIVFVLVWAIIAITALASDQIGASEFLTATVPLAAAYLLSRGLAKLGKVIENR